MDNISVVVGQAPSEPEIDRIREAYKAALSSPNGQVMLRDLVLEHVINPDPPVASEILQRMAGRREVVLGLLRMALNDPQKEVEFVISAINNSKEDK